MKLGVSSYSLAQAIKSGDLTILGAIDWIVEHGGEHIEIVPIGFNLTEDRQLAAQIRVKAASVGIDVSNYAIGANFLKDSPQEFRAEIDQVKQHVDIAAELGVLLMRHDVAGKPPSADISLRSYEADLPRLVEACQEIAEYAQQYNITTSVENHGFYIQSSERVYRLVMEVNRSNFRTTLDVGNFLCADEDPLLAVQRNLEIASIVHLKDFYRRPPSAELGEGWFKSAGGYHLRGSILGHGDVNLAEIMNVVRSSGYDGYLSLEFEGLEECRQGTRMGLEQARRLWAQATK